MSLGRGAVERMIHELAPRFWWGTVTQASPLRVRRDGSPVAPDATPDTLVAGLVVGDRVRCESYGRLVVVHGKAQ